VAETSEDFADLMQRARQNDNEAIAKLCGQYESKLRIVAHVLLGPALRPHLDSVDLVQSVHRTLMVGLREEKFDISTPEKLVALALTIVRRKVARHWRRVQRQQRLSGGGTQIESLPVLLGNLGSSELDPARAAQLRDQVQQLCLRLSDIERQLIQMRADGYSTQEIADALNLNHTTLRVRMTRLRERLRTSGVFSDWL
jgi:RNA polymerase sigma factor (sigma-70 family)